MEVSGVVFRPSPCFSPDASNSFSVMRRPNSIRCHIKPLGEFSDKSHLQYYSGEVLSKKKDMKKQLKVLKGLSKNLSTFSEMGFCLHPDSGLDQQVKGQIISEATEVLIAQLQKLKQEKMESKRMKKQERAKKKASRVMTMTKTECKDSSSSSSESSSESDCDNVVDMSQLKTAAASNTHQEATSVQDLEKVENRLAETAIGIVASNAEVDCNKKIEVCMGGKCKKSGAAMLLENFQKAVGGEAEVVGCKCMGKCREGPNVKVHSEEAAAAAVASSLCIGVGLEDVDMIVTNFFGGSLGSCSGMVPALSSV